MTCRLGVRAGVTDAVRAADFQPTNVWPADLQPANIGPADFEPTHVGPADFQPADVRLSHANR